MQAIFRSVVEQDTRWLSLTGKKPTEELDRKVKSLESKVIAQKRSANRPYFTPCLNFPLLFCDLWQAKFSRSEYVLELAAANAYYSKFRDDQFPEVLDVRFVC